MIKYELLNGRIVEAFGDYHKAEKRAQKLGLKLAEYGNKYRKPIAYAYFNETGNRNDAEAVIVYYLQDKSGKAQALTDEQLESLIFEGRMPS